MNQSGIKVLHLIDSGGLYGAEKMLLSLCEEQKSQGLAPTILSCGLPGELQKPLEAEAVSQDIDVFPWRMKAGLNIWQMYHLLSWAKGKNYQIFHSHGYKFNILIALLYPLAKKFKLVTTVHGYVQAKKWTPMWLYELLDKMALRVFDKVVLVSQKMLEIPAIKNISEARRTVISNGISTAFSNAELDATISNYCEKFSFRAVAVGRLSQEKGFDYLINAIALLFKKHPLMKEQFCLTIFGEGPKKSELQTLITDLSLDENIRLAGYCSNVSDILPHFELLVMPSLTEGLPITLLEAMRAKCPILASAVGGIPNLLNADSAYLVETGSSEKLAFELERVITEGGMSIKAEKAYLKFREEYTSEVMAKSYLAVYQ